MVQKMPRRAVAASAAPEASSISSGLSIIGKIVGHGALTIFGQVEGELRASTVLIAEGAQMGGDVVCGGIDDRRVRQGHHPCQPR